MGSSTLASNATHLAGGYAKNLVLDLAFALQVRSSALTGETAVWMERARESPLGLGSNVAVLLLLVCVDGYVLRNYELTPPSSTGVRPFGVLGHDGA